MKKINILSVLLFLTASLLLSGGLQAQIDFQRKGIPNTKNDPASASLSDHLILLEEAYLRENPFAMNALPGFLQIKDRLVMVDITIWESNDELIPRLHKAGMKDIVRFKNVIGGWLPISVMREIALWPEVAYVKPSPKPLAHTGSVSNQADSAQRSYLARMNFSVDGSGVKIGALSDSYNTLGGEAAAILSGDLPGVGNPNGKIQPVDVVADYSGTGTDEGRAILEMIHDVAPGADLAFATAYSSQAQFATNILALASAGCDVIVEDVRYFASPFFQDGIIAQAADSVVNMGIGYYSAAGNQGAEGYMAPYDPAYLNSTYDVHKFGGSDYTQQITVAGKTTVSLVLQWDNPFTSVTGGAGPTADLDLFILRNGGIVTSSTSSNTFGGDAYEIVQFYNNSSSSRTYDIVVGKDKNLSSTSPSRIAYVYFADGDVSIDEYATKSATCYGQSNASLAGAVGAAYYLNTPFYGVNKPLAESYSSMGGMPILFDKNGNAIPEIPREAPMFTAPDGVNTTFFGVDVADDEDSYPNFFGTSASVAFPGAIHALMLQKLPGATVSQIQTAMKNTCVDMADPGFDFETGYGLINAEAAITELTNSLPVVLQDFVARNEQGGVRLQWYVSKEEAFKGYEIQMAKAGETFEAVDFVDARQANSYEYLINKIAPGLHRFRLKMVDIDGSYTISPERQVEVGEGLTQWSAFMNPQTNTLSFQPEQEIPGQVQVKIWDMGGKLIKDTRLEGHNMEVLLNGTETGVLVYQLKWLDGNRASVYTGKLVR